MQALLTTISNFSPYITLGLFVAAIISLFVSLTLSVKLSKFMKGENGASLEPIIRTYINEIESLKSHDELLSKHAISLESRLQNAVQSVSMLRFKAFESGSSNQSFAIALLNEHGDGVVVSSIHHREHISFFAKKISKYKSEHELTEEEEQVVYDSKEAHKKGAHQSS